MKIGRAAVGERVYSRDGRQCYQVVRYVTPEESILEELRKGRSPGTKDHHSGQHRYLVQAVKDGQLDEKYFFVMSKSIYRDWARRTK